MGKKFIKNSYTVQDVTMVEKKETSKKVIKWYLQPKSWFARTPLDQRKGISM